MSNRNFKLKVLFVLLAALSIGCNKRNKKESKIFFYNRSVLTDNKGVSYFDNLVITNFELNTFKVDSLVKIAKVYIDTSKSDKPISSITFLGLKTGGKLPPIYSNYIDEQAELKLIAIGFENSKGFLRDIRSMAIWNYGNRLPAYSWDRMMRGSSHIDSALKSRYPLKNDF